MVEEIKESVTKIIKERCGSVLYGTFAISWFIWNWEFWYITLFLDQQIIFDATKLLKLDYLLKQYHFSSSYLFNIWILIKLILGPALSTYLIIYQISKLDIKCFDKNIKNEAEKEIKKYESDEEVAKKKGEALKIEESNLKIENEIKKEMTDEQKWEDEYQRKKDDSFFNGVMNELKDCIYRRSGFLFIENEKVNPNILSYWDVNLLTENIDHRYVKATEKGKYFLKKYLEKHFNE